MTRLRRIGTAACSLMGLLFIASTTSAADAEAGARVVEFYGYDDCIRLENRSTRVTLCPAAGGRVLEYSLDGKNALYLPPGNEGWTYEPGKKGGAMTAGRFDVGPEYIIAKHPVLWMGRWKGEVTGPRSARLTSAKDKASGLQLVRDFTLDDKTSRLDCKQTIRNVSSATIETCHWSRTFALGGGICVIPLTQPSRFPNGYVMYNPDKSIQIHPEDDNIRQRDGFLEILAAPKHPKLGMETSAGWFAYVMRNDVMFVKQFPVNRDRVYNEVAGLTMSIWYPDAPMCELEPIGPRERIEPGKSASFTETWWLLPRKFPAAGTSIDLKKLASQVDAAVK